MKVRDVIKTPIRAELRMAFDEATLIDATGRFIAMLSDPMEPRQIEVAKAIVVAVNAHADLDIEPIAMPPPPARPPGLLARFLRWMTSAPDEPAVRLAEVMHMPLKAVPYDRSVVEIHDARGEWIGSFFSAKHHIEHGNAVVDILNAYHDAEVREDALARAQMQYGTHW